MKELAIEVLAVPMAAAVLLTVLVSAVVESLLQSVRTRRRR